MDWQRVHFLFDEDDGGLIQLSLTGVDADAVAAIFDFIRRNARLHSDSVFWDRRRQRDERVANSEDAARLVLAGLADPFHVLAQQLTFMNVCLPDIGVFILPDEVQLDYWPGDDWREPQALAFFELLSQLTALAPAARIETQWLPEVERAFIEEWSKHRASAPPS